MTNGSDLLEFGQRIIAGMRTTTGEGEPDDGAQFGEGHRGFVQAGETLQSAVADDRWDGTGSRAYADQNTRQQMRSETMADADQAVFAVLVREARQIKHRRNTLDDQSDILAKTSYATFPLQSVPCYGEAAKLAIESTALTGALLASSQALHQLHSEVSANAAELSQAVGRYAAVAEAAEPPGGDFNPPEPFGGGVPPTVDPQEPTGRAGPITDSVNRQNSPVPMAGTSSQDTKLGEGAHGGG